MQGGRRLLLAVLGVASLGVYLVVAFAGYRVLATVWSQRPSAGTAALVVVGTALAMGALSYWVGTSQIRRSVDAVELPRSRAPGVYRRFDSLTERMDVSTPALLVARLPVPNAFAVGGSERAVIVDRRLFGYLSADELEALLAHELAHLETHDAFVQTVLYSLLQSVVGLVAIAVLPLVALAGGIARALALIRGRPGAWSGSWFAVAQRRTLQFVGLLGFAITLLALAYSRRREWAADDRAVSVTGKPLALARALGKIERASAPDLGPLTPLYVHGTEDDELSHLLSTHPPMDERIERLRARARQNVERPA